MADAILSYDCYNQLLAGLERIESSYNRVSFTDRLELDAEEDREEVLRRINCLPCSIGGFGACPCTYRTYSPRTVTSKCKPRQSVKAPGSCIFFCPPRCYFDGEIIRGIMSTLLLTLRSIQTQLCLALSTPHAPRSGWRLTTCMHCL